VKQKVPHTEHFSAVMEALTSRGLLLASYDAAGKPNAMTIGWGTVGSIWGLPVWIVLVRPSRHTHACIERRGAFTVNIPPAALAGACATCGSTSGRDTDKFARCGLTPEKASAVDAPIVAECPLVYECRVVHSLDVLPERLAPAIRSGAYQSGDYHRLYFGEILAARAEPDAGRLLA
jgi:flavin reductase (DIM6/NTAB) family NADH-FMN oxidoreductase RutF